MRKSTFALALIAGCSDVPDREKFPGGHGRTTDIQAVETQRAVLGGFDPMKNQLPAESPPPTQGAAPAAEGLSVRGKISLGPKVVVKDGMMLFIAARPVGGGPPIAAIRMGRPDFPYEFKLSGENAMMAGTPFEGEMEITARLDQDGDPLSREAGDWVGSLKTKAGDPKADIRIDQPAN